MNIRKLHLYLGCFFAPLLVFFAVSGAWQTLGFGIPWKIEHAGGIWEKPNELLSQISRVHKYVREPIKDHKFKPFSAQKDDARRLPYMVFLILMSLGLVATTILGVVMAFRMTKQRVVVCALLVGGVAVPGLLFWLGKLR